MNNIIIINLFKIININLIIINDSLNLINILFVINN